MAYNTKELLKDKYGNPISQYYNPVLDVYEPLEGASGANKVTIIDNPLSLVPILDKLGQLTGTVIDEETRKSNELDRKSNEQVRQDNINEFKVWEVYDSSKRYLPLNKVYYQGGSYICNKISAGNTPTNELYWTKIVSKGDKGDRGTDGVVNTVDGQFVLEIRLDGNLWLLYEDDTTPPNIFINDNGELIYDIV